MSARRYRSPDGGAVLPKLAIASAAALLVAGACDGTVLQPQPTRLAMSVAPAEVEADGAARATITIRRDGALLPDAVRARLTTTRGTLLGGARGTEATISLGDTTTVQLQAPRRPGVAYLGVTLNGRSAANDTVRFVPAFPDEIEIASDRVVVAADGSTAVTVTARLLRTQGRVSLDLGVRFEVVDEATGTPIANISRTVVSDSAGLATLKLTSTIPTALLVAARVEGEASDVLRVRFAN